MTNLEQFDPIIIAESHRWKIPGMEWQDIAQEVRIRLWQQEKTFKGESSYKTWANRVMKNCIKNLLRDSTTKKARILNRALSVDELKEKGLDIADNGRVYKDYE